jgi:hypothetical protein
VGENEREMRMCLADNKMRGTEKPRKNRQKEREIERKSGVN